MIVAVTLHISQNIVEIMLINQISAVTRHIGIMFCKYSIFITVETYCFLVAETIVARYQHLRKTAVLYSIFWENPYDSGWLSLDFVKKITETTEVI